MKKRVLTVFLVAVLLMACLTPLAMARATEYSPLLYFTGTTANCSMEANAGKNDYITATLKLMYGTTQLAAWTSSGYQRVVINNKSKEVEKGKTYTLMAIVKINGEEMPVATTSATC